MGFYPSILTGPHASTSAKSLGAPEHNWPDNTTCCMLSVCVCVCYLSEFTLVFMLPGGP